MISPLKYYKGDWWTVFVGYSRATFRKSKHVSKVGSHSTDTPSDSSEIALQKSISKFTIIRKTE